jgi:UDP-glucuronate 4-epimerase
MNLLITGSSGFIGSHLVRHFQAAGHTVTPFDLLNGGWDVGKYADIDYWLLDSTDAIIHLAALTGVTPSWDHPQDYIDTNVKGSVNVLQAAAARSIPVILASSSSVYSHPRLEETAPLFPRTPYGASKAAMEQFARLYVDKIPVTVLRLFNVYGEGGRKDMLPYKALRAAHSGEVLTLRGDPRLVSRDWTFIDDVVRAFDLALHKMDGYQVYNIGTGAPVTLQAFVRQVEIVADFKPLTLAYADLLPGEVLVTRADNFAADKHLDWQPLVDFPEGLAAMARWFAESEVKHG